MKMCIITEEVINRKMMEEVRITHGLCLILVVALAMTAMMSFPALAQSLSCQELDKNGQSGSQPSYSSSSKYSSAECPETVKEIGPVTYRAIAIRAIAIVMAITFTIAGTFGAILLTKS